VAAAISGAAAYMLGPSVVFYLLAVMSLGSLISVLAIPEKAIDHELARGLQARQQGQDRAQDNRAQDNGERLSAFGVLLGCRPLLIFAICVALFHLANAAMLPLVGQKLALQDKNLGTSLMSACIAAAQLVMVPMAMLVGARADRWGHKRFFLTALLILPLRAVLYTLSDNKAWLVGVQLLDGVGAGIFGAIMPVIVADLMRNTGRFNVAQGAVITAQSIGAALSTTLAGVVVVHAGYSAGFLTLGAVAVLGVAFCATLLPETRNEVPQQSPQTAPSPSAIAAQ
jgi:MFS family permease